MGVLSRDLAKLHKFGQLSFHDTLSHDEKVSGLSLVIRHAKTHLAPSFQQELSAQLIGQLNGVNFIMQLLIKLSPSWKSFSGSSEKFSGLVIYGSSHLLQKLMENHFKSFSRKWVLLLVVVSRKTH